VFPRRSRLPVTEGGPFHREHPCLPATRREVRRWHRRE
jgi:hypothetical protein